MTPNFLSWAYYGVHIMRIFEKIDRVIMAPFISHTFTSGYTATCSIPYRSDNENRRGFVLYKCQHHRYIHSLTLVLATKPHITNVRILVMGIREPSYFVICLDMKYIHTMHNKHIPCVQKSCNNKASRFISIFLLVIG